MAYQVHCSAFDGVQQARQYAEFLGLKFAYATNGHELIEIDYFTGKETAVTDYPDPETLWKRYQAGAGIKPSMTAPLLQPFNHAVGKGERYYQQIAISRITEAILKGQRRVLVTMATGTGKTAVAFQLCWKLWSSRWNRTGDTVGRGFCISPIATSWSISRRTGSSRRSAMHGTRSNRARSSTAGKFTSRCIRPWPRMSGARDCLGVRARLFRPHHR